MSTDLEEKLSSATQELLKKDEENLLEELGMRAKATALDLSKQGEPNLSVTYQGTLMGPMDEVYDLGLRIAKRWVKELHNIVCGSEGADEEDRKKLQGAFGLSGEQLAMALAGFMVATFGVAAAIATVVAAIVVKRFGGGALDEFCKKSSEWIK